MIAFILKKGDDKLLGALTLQKSKDFTVYLPQDDPAEADYTQLHFRHSDWQLADEPLVCFLEEGALPGPGFVGSVLRAAQRHPDFDVYHVDTLEAKAFPRKTDNRKLFQLVLMQNTPAPLSGFVFRSEKLREKAVMRADGTLDPLPTLFSCAQQRPVRSVWHESLAWTAPAPSPDPAQVQRQVQEKLELFRWTESFFGDDDYPLSVGDQLKLFATELAGLYPSYTADELKELMYGFQVAQGPVRKLRAGNALKAALKQRQLQLQESEG